MGPVSCGRREQPRLHPGGAALKGKLWGAPGTPPRLLGTSSWRLGRSGSYPGAEEAMGAAAGRWREDPRRCMVEELSSLREQTLKLALTQVISGACETRASDSTWKRPHQLASENIVRPLDLSLARVVRNPEHLIIAHLSRAVGHAGCRRVRSCKAWRRAIQKCFPEAHIAHPEHQTHLRWPWTAPSLTQGYPRRQPGCSSDRPLSSPLPTLASRCSSACLPGRS